MQTGLNFLRAITMCSASNFDCGFANSTFFLIGDVYCPNTKCSGKVCLHKTTFQSLGRSDYQCPQCASVCQMRNIPFEDQTHFFFLSFGPGVYIFEERPKSIQDVIGDVYCPGKYSLNREKFESLDGYVTTPRYIYGGGKCGAWLFVHKVPFTLQEHVKTTKTEKTRFFSAKKRWTWYPTNNWYLMFQFNQPNIERKNCVWTKKHKRLLEMCIVQHVELKNVFLFQPIKRLVFTTVKSAKPAATFWIFLLRTKNRQCCCWRWWNTLLCKKGESRLRKRKTISDFEEFSPPITSKLIWTGTKKSKVYSIHGKIVSRPHWLIQLSKNSFTLSFYKFSVYIKGTWLSQSSTTVLSGLSILD